jgi:hypothetical protein
MVAVIRDIGLGPKLVGDLLLRARRDVLVFLEFRDARLVRAGNVLVSSALLIVGQRRTLLQ